MKINEYVILLLFYLLLMYRSFLFFFLHDYFLHLGGREGREGGIVQPQAQSRFSSAPSLKIVACVLHNKKKQSIVPFLFFFFFPSSS